MVPTEKREAQVKAARARYEAKRKAEKAGASGEASISERGNVREVTRVTDEHVRTLDDLIRVCEIDTSVWEVERWVANKWEVGAKNDSKQLVTKPLFQVKAWLRRKVYALAVRQEIEALVRASQARIVPGPYVGPDPKLYTAADHVLEIAIPDLHLGKLAWSRETGHASYDTKIAKRLFEQALTTLLARTSGFNFERIVFVVGNDLLNADNSQDTTTAGTPQDCDGRFQKTFIVAREMIVNAVERLRAVAVTVEVIVVPGNHDQLSSWFLGDSLAMYFKDTPGVLIDNEPKLRKYRQYGKVMLMWTHGDTGKKGDYPLLMATEMPHVFGDTQFREAHTGHTHQTGLAEYHGVRVRICPALCPPDAWHSKKQFVGNQRGAEAFVWSRTEGLVGMAFFSS